MHRTPVRRRGDVPAQRRTCLDRSGDRERWRDHYLHGWEDFASHDVASDLFERMAPLAAMHQAITYRWLLGSLDPSERWQFGSAFQDWVARALAPRSLAV